MDGTRLYFYSVYIASNWSDVFSKPWKNNKKQKQLIFFLAFSFISFSLWWIFVFRKNGFTSIISYIFYPLDSSLLYAHVELGAFYSIHNREHKLLTCALSFAFYFCSYNKSVIIIGILNIFLCICVVNKVWHTSWYLLRVLFLVVVYGYTFVM